MLLRWTARTADQVDLSAFVLLAGRSAALAAAAAVVVVLCGLFFAYARRVKRTVWMASLTGLAGAGYAVPGAVIAVGVFALGAVLDAGARTVGLAGAGQLLLGGSVTALVWAYGVRFLAVGLQPVDAGFVRQGPSLDEAARTLGSGPLRTLLTVHVPLLKGALAGAATLAFVDVLKELPLTLILRPFDFATLATHTYELASEEMVPASAPSALVLVAFGLVAVAVAQRGLLTDEEA
jgi:iron(III) transport system permease protein